MKRLRIIWFILFLLLSNLYGMGVSSVGDTVSDTFDNTVDSISDLTKNAISIDPNIGNEDDDATYSADLCYEPRETSGNCFNMGFCSGGMNCKKAFPIKNTSGVTLSDVEIYYDQSGASASYKSTCNIEEPEHGTCEIQNNVNLGGTIGFMNKTAHFRITEQIQNQHSFKVAVTDKIGGACFLHDKIYAIYKKPDGQTYKGKLRQCSDSGGGVGSNETTGPFDAWDNDESILTRVIKTKVVTKDFSLDGAIIKPIKIVPNAKIRYQLRGVDGFSTPWKELQLANSILTPTNSIGYPSFHLDFSGSNLLQASKDVRVHFQYCLKNNILVDYSYCTESELEDSTSSDNFALRPYGFKTFGTNQYRRASENFNITIKALSPVEYNKTSGTVNSVNSVIGYNQPLTSLTINPQPYKATAKELKIMRKNVSYNDVDICPNIGGFGIVDGSATASNGTLYAQLIYTETGILSLDINETLGKEFAIVDSDDTPTSQRFIKAALGAYDKNDINQSILMVFIPYQFSVQASYDTTMTNKNWIYMQNITNQKPAQAAVIHYTITAQDFYGNTVKNYTKTCFPDVTEHTPYQPATDCPQRNGLKLNTTFDLFLDATLNVNSNPNISVYVDDNLSSAVWVPNKHIQLNQGNNHIQEWVGSDRFHNGIGKVNLYFNIDRDVNKPLNPFKIKIKDANTSISWASNAGAPQRFIPEKNFQNDEVTFLYARSYAPTTTIKGSDGDVFIYYENYCFKTDTLGTTCDTSLLPDGTNAKTLDDPRWFINSKHTQISGIAGAITQKRATHITATQQPDGVLETNKDYDKTSLHYDQQSGYPYKATMQMQSSPWLIFNKYDTTATQNEFELQFHSDTSGWVGSGETDSATETKRGAKDRKLTW